MVNVSQTSRWPLIVASNVLDDLRIAQYAPPEAPNGRIVIVSIDETTLRRWPYRSPIDRAFPADLVRKLDAARRARRSS